MSPEERLAVQRVVVDFLQQDAPEHPTRLIDVLLSGDGWQLVHHVLSHEEAHARGRAETLGYLLKALLAERVPPSPAAPGPLSPQPPIPPFAPSVPRSE